MSRKKTLKALVREYLAAKDEAGYAQSVFISDRDRHPRISNEDAQRIPSRVRFVEAAHAEDNCLQALIEAVSS